MPTMDASLPAGVDPKVAVWCGGLDAGQGRLLDLLKGLGPDQLALVPQGLSNSLATLAVHVAATEVRMAYRIMGQQVPADLPPDLQAEYLIDQPQNPLPQPRGETAESLVGKLQKARGVLMQVLGGLGEADLEREIRLGPERTATVRWALGILPTHQTQHFGQMQMIRKLV